MAGPTPIPPDAQRHATPIIQSAPPVSPPGGLPYWPTDDGVERYPDKRSVKILIRSAIGEPDASIFLNWIDALDRMPMRKAATERSGAAFRALLRRIDRHAVTLAQAGPIRRALMGRC